MTPCTDDLLASLNQLHEHPSAITLACKWRTGCHLWRDPYRAFLLLCPGHYLLRCWEVHHQIAPAKSHTNCHHEGPLLQVVIKPPCWPWTSACYIEVGDAVALPCKSHENKRGSAGRAKHTSGGWWLAAWRCAWLPIADCASPCPTIAPIVGVFIAAASMKNAPIHQRHGSAASLCLGLESG